MWINCLNQHIFFSFHCKFANSGPSLGGRCALLASISVNWEVKNHAEIDTKTGLNEPVFILGVAILKSKCLDGQAEFFLRPSSPPIVGNQKQAELFTVNPLQYLWRTLRSWSPSSSFLLWNAMSRLSSPLQSSSPPTVEISLSRLSSTYSPSSSHPPPS